MKENNILIFEDEWPTIRGSFDLANQFAFNGKLHFNSISRSQDITFSSWNGIYDAVFVDITLAKNSALDGFYIIKEIMYISFERFVRNKRIEYHVFTIYLVAGFS